MGRLRKVLVGAVAALATLAAGLVGAGTANAAGTESIDITGTGLTASNFKAYELVHYDNITPSSGVATSVTPARVSSSSTALEDDIVNAMHSADSRISAGGAGENAAAEGELLNLSRTSDGATLAAVAQRLSGSTNLGNEINASASSDGVQFTNLDPGLYLIIDNDSDTANKSKPMIVSSTVNGETTFGTSNEPIGSMHVKSASSYKPHKSYTASGATGSDPYVAVGDVAHFTVTMTIPDGGSYQSFSLEDAPHGYDILVGSDHPVNVYVGDTTTPKYSITDKTRTVLAASSSTASGALAATTLTWPTSGAADNGFVFTDNEFVNDANGKDAAWLSDSANKNASSLLADSSNWGKTLTIKYDAQVTDPGATNTVGSSLENYSGSHTPEPGNTTKNGSAGEPLATFKKVAATNRHTPVSGATFTLQNIVTNEYWSKAEGSDTWSHETVATGANPPVMTTNNHGEINLDGLTQGTYRLVEKSAPTDYMQTLTPGVTTADITITVNSDGTVSEAVASNSSTASGLVHDDTTGTASPKKFKTVTTTDPDGVLVGYSQTADPDHSGNPLVFSLGNLHNISELPATGGAGIIAGLILVALLLAIGGSFIAISRKMRKDRQQAEGVRA